MYNASALIGGSFSLIAPFMGPPLIAIWEPLPLVVFGSLGVVSGALVFLLPDTSKADLPDTIRDAEELGTDKERRRDKEAEVDQEMTSAASDGAGDYGSVRYRAKSNASSKSGIDNTAYEGDTAKAAGAEESHATVSIAEAGTVQDDGQRF